MDPFYSPSNMALPVHRQIQPFTIYRVRWGPFQGPLPCDGALLPSCPFTRSRGSELVCAGSGQT